MDELHAIHREGLPLRRELEKLSAALSGPFQSFGRKADDRALSVLRNAFGEVASSVFACAASRIAAGEAPAETKLRELDELARQAEATAGLAQGLRSDIALDIAMVKARVKLGRR